MSGEVNILKIDYSGSSANSEVSDVAFTVIGDDRYYEKNRFTGKESNKNFEKKVINLSSMSEDFVSKLDAKLKNLEENETKRKKKNFKNNKLEQRPLFITTVKTGIFLDPPPELAALLGYPPRSNASSGSNISEKSSDGLMYSFSSQPRVLNKTKPKINNDRQNLNNEKLETKNNLRQKREINTKKKEMPPPEVIPYGNIMYDRRVVRGPAFMHQPLPTMGVQSPAARQAEARRRAMARRKAQTTRARNLRLRLGTPPPVEGRKHEDIQTEEYLEELFEHPPTENVLTQTDYFVDRPPTPTFIPMKTGVDASTQIYQGELFHFDVEVKPILEVLVGKTVEQSLVEVMEEDELATIKEQQQRFKDLRDSEKAEEARLEEEEARRSREMEIRAIEQEEGLMNQRAAEDRITAAVLTTGYIADLLPTVVKDLNKGGFLYDEVRQEVDEKFMPWLMQEVKTELQKVVENKDLLSGMLKISHKYNVFYYPDILREIIDTRAEMYAAIGDKVLPDEEGAEEEEIGSPFPQIEGEEGEEEQGEEEESKDADVN